MTSHLNIYQKILTSDVTCIHQFYNQRRAKLQSLLKGNRQSSQRIRRLTRCRNQKVDDYLHQASRYLVNLFSLMVLYEPQNGMTFLVFVKSINT